jgi:hypothetical protein
MLSTSTRKRTNKTLDRSARSVVFDVCKASSSHSVRGILSCLASDFVVLVLSEAVLSETVLVLDGCLNCGDADR